jgi:hypothetical protein
MHNGMDPNDSNFYIVLVCMLSLVCSHFAVGRSWHIAPNVVAMLRVKFDSC